MNNNSSSIKIYSLLIIFSGLFFFCSVTVTGIFLLRIKHLSTDLQAVIDSQNDFLSGQQDILDEQQRLLDEYRKSLLTANRTADDNNFSRIDQELLFKRINEATERRFGHIEHRLQIGEEREKSRFEETDTVLSGLVQSGEEHFQHLKRQLETSETRWEDRFSQLGMTGFSGDGIPREAIASEYRKFGDKSIEDGAYSDASAYYKTEGLS